MPEPMTAESSLAAHYLRAVKVLLPESEPTDGDATKPLTASPPTDVAAPMVYDVPLAIDGELTSTMPLYDLGTLTAKMGAEFSIST